MPRLSPSVSNADVAERALLIIGDGPLVAPLLEALRGHSLEPEHAQPSAAIQAIKHGAPRLVLFVGRCTADGGRQYLTSVSQVSTTHRTRVLLIADEQQTCANGPDVAVLSGRLGPYRLADAVHRLVKRIAECGPHAPPLSDLVREVSQGLEPRQASKRVSRPLPPAQPPLGAARPPTSDGSGALTGPAPTPTATRGFGLTALSQLLPPAAAGASDAPTVGPVREPTRRQAAGGATPSRAPDLQEMRLPGRTRVKPSGSSAHASPDDVEIWLSDEGAPPDGPVDGSSRSAAPEELEISVDLPGTSEALAAASIPPSIPAELPDESKNGSLGAQARRRPMGDRIRSSLVRASKQLARATGQGVLRATTWLRLRRKTPGSGFPAEHGMRRVPGRLWGATRRLLRRASRRAEGRPEHDAIKRPHWLPRMLANGRQCAHTLKASVLPRLAAALTSSMTALAQVTAHTGPARVAVPIVLAGLTVGFGLSRTLVEPPKATALASMLVVSGGAMQQGAAPRHSERSSTDGRTSTQTAEPVEAEDTLPPGSGHPPRTPTVSAQASTGASSEPDTDGSRLRPSTTDQGASARRARIERANRFVAEGHRLRKQGRLGLAESSYISALSALPRYPRALAGLVRVHLQRKASAEAVRWARKLTGVQPRRANNQLLLGDAYALYGARSAAKQAWRKAARYGSTTARKRLQQKRR